jgi:hypothetical protein
MSTKVPVQNLTQLNNVSISSPSLSGDFSDGILIAWSDDGKIFIATDQDTPQYTPHLVNASWSTRSTPAVVVIPDWGRVYLAWADPFSNIMLGCSKDGFKQAFQISRNGSDFDGPALAYGDDLLYVAWRKNSSLCVATVDFDGNVIHYNESGGSAYIFSRPTLTFSDGNLYALSGGYQEEKNSQLTVFLSTDHGDTFNPVSVQAVSSWGPPSLAIIDKNYYLVWTDAQDYFLRSATTKDLTKFSITDYSTACYGGGPALLGLADKMVIGWSSYKEPSQYASSNPIVIAELPIAIPANRIAAREEAGVTGKQHRLRAPVQPCGPGTVWDPVQKKCVSKTGCWGACVLSSFTLSPIGPIFNPIKYAVCVISCKSHE